MSRVWLDYAIEVVGIVSELLLLTVLLRKERWRALPVLTLLAAFTPLEDLVLDVAKHHVSDNAYFYGYWSFAVFDYLLELALLYEVARKILKPGQVWIVGAWREFTLLSSVGFMLVVVVVLWTVRPFADFRVVFYKCSSLLTSFLTSVAFVALSATANRFRLPRNNHALAIGFGLAAWNITSLIGDVSGSNNVDGSRFGFWYYARIIVWDVVVLYWATALRAKCNESERALNVQRFFNISSDNCFSQPLIDHQNVSM